MPEKSIRPKSKEELAAQVAESGLENNELNSLVEIKLMLKDLENSWEADEHGQAIEQSSFDIDKVLNHLEKE